MPGGREQRDRERKKSCPKITGFFKRKSEGLFFSFLLLLFVFNTVYHNCKQHVPYLSKHRVHYYNSFLTISTCSEEVCDPRGDGDEEREKDVPWKKAALTIEGIQSVVGLERLDGFAESDFLKGSDVIVIHLIISIIAVPVSN